MEQIYTIPVNEAFEAARDDHSLGCPFCSLAEKLEANEIDLILGASMMEPDVRIKTNEQGFCRHHYDMMFGYKNRLGLALMLESHLDEQRKNFSGGGLFSKPGEGEIKAIGKLDGDCYVCTRIEYHFSKMLETAALLWDKDPEFQKKLTGQPWFCLPHYKRFLEAAKARLSKKRFSEFFEQASSVENKYFDELREDVSWFCKKFDYRYKDEPWNNSKDAVERVINFISGRIQSKK